MDKIENPPAFPRDERYLGHNGMTLRDYFAGQALAGMLNMSFNPEHHARLSYQFADAMLLARKEPTQ